MSLGCVVEALRVLCVLCVLRVLLVLGVSALSMRSNTWEEGGPRRSAPRHGGVSGFGGTEWCEGRARAEPWCPNVGTTRMSKPRPIRSTHGRMRARSLTCIRALCCADARHARVRASTLANARSSIASLVAARRAAAPAPPHLQHCVKGRPVPGRCAPAARHELGVGLRHDRQHRRPRAPQQHVLHHLQQGGGWGAATVAEMGKRLARSWVHSVGLCRRGARSGQIGIWGQKIKRTGSPKRSQARSWGGRGPWRTQGLGPGWVDSGDLKAPLMRAQRHTHATAPPHSACP